MLPTPRAVTHGDRSKARTKLGGQNTALGHQIDFWPTDPSANLPRNLPPTHRQKNKNPEWSYAEIFKATVSPLFWPSNVALHATILRCHSYLLRTAVPPLDTMDIRGRTWISMVNHGYLSLPMIAITMADHG